MIDILMAVYNGEKYLAEQIDSILCQTEQNFKLIICDDVSSDSSFEIAQRYAHQYPNKVECYQNEKPSGSAQANFMGMLKSSSADYIMFADQDDYWHTDKIKLTLDNMRELEGKFPDSPLLVHTELEIADSELNVISPAFTRFQGLDPRRKTLNRLLCQNNITGCTVMMNKALTELVKNVPPQNMLMHDWWAGLAAAAFGHIGFVETPTIKYRQHGSNRLGAVNNRNPGGVLKTLRSSQQTKKRILMTYTQAQGFYEYYKPMLGEESRKILEIYTDIPRHSKLSRAARLVKYGFLKQNFITAAGQLIFC